MRSTRHHSGIIETGFLKLDYDILTNKTDLVATGVANGILCFVNKRKYCTDFCAVDFTYSKPLKVTSWNRTNLPPLN